MKGVLIPQQSNQIINAIVNIYASLFNILQASRQTISRLSDYAELADQETKEQLNQLYSTLQKEKDHSKFVERKHQQYKDASLRQFENLLHETGDFGDIS